MQHTLSSQRSHIVCISHTHTPVSYTHLDVYKRQCENYLTVITDVVRKALYDNINQAIHDLDICNFIVSPNGLADLLPERQLNIPLISLKLDKFFL